MMWGDTFPFSRGDLLSAASEFRDARNGSGDPPYFHSLYYGGKK